MFAGLALKTWGGLSNRDRGWLVLVGVVVFPPLWLYVGAYFALVVPQRWTEVDVAEEKLDRLPIPVDRRGSEWTTNKQERQKHPEREKPEHRQRREKREQRLRGLATPEYRHSKIVERFISLKLERFFRPIHEADRVLRPQTWGPDPSRPAPSLPPIP
jgi:hypothetical protein